jgi:hypothetical protein
MPKPKKKPLQTPDAWQNRILSTGIADPQQIAAHPLNHRIHSEFQKRAMSGAFREIGWLQHVTINQRTGRLIDGHLRVALACRDKQPAVPVSYVDLSPEEELAALASMDAIGSLVDIDYNNLDAILSATSIGDPDLEALFGDLSDQADIFKFEQAGNGAASPGGKRGDKSKQIRAVLYADEIAVFEQALAATGNINRGEAIVQVCRGYLDARAKR